MSRANSGMRGKMQFSMGGFEPKEAVENIAGGIGELNRLNVYRVLAENSEDALEIADYIKEERPDLAGEVNHLLKTYGVNWS